MVQIGIGNKELKSNPIQILVVESCFCVSLFYLKLNSIKDSHRFILFVFKYILVWCMNFIIQHMFFLQLNTFEIVRSFQIDSNFHSFWQKLSHEIYSTVVLISWFHITFFTFFLSTFTKQLNINLFSLYLPTEIKSQDLTYKNFTIHRLKFTEIIQFSYRNPQTPE